MLLVGPSDAGKTALLAQVSIFLVIRGMLELTEPS